jgi:inosine-uridine nucleoside N-ribohydrolase|tara:strand:+ start:197 stop:1108 length:912 start_codon:yes stop_codon:yes gene_type:complete
MPIPVILDTDIGLDVDDVWALAYLLQCPELEVKLITTCTGDTTYRAALVAKMLEVAGRTDIPIGIGLAGEASLKTHSEWLGDYQLADYPGLVHADGISAIADTILTSEEAVTLIAIGPLTNVAAALDHAPAIVENAKFVGMHGSLRVGYVGIAKAMREFNVVQDAPACQKVFAASWSKTITPLDTCGMAALKHDQYKQVAASKSRLTQAVLQNHHNWFKAALDWPVMVDLVKSMDPEEQSSILYDCVAVYLAFSEEGVGMEDLHVLVTDDGKTLIDEQGHLVRCATHWLDDKAFYQNLCARLS